MHGACHRVLIMALLSLKTLSKRLFFFAAAGFWVALLLLGLWEQYEAAQGQHGLVPIWLKGVLLNGFIVTLYYGLRIHMESRGESDFYGLIRDVFFNAGTFAVIVFLPVWFFFLLHDELPFLYQLLVDSFLFYLEFGLFTFFLISTYMRWRSMVLHRRTKWLDLLWRLFEYALLLTTLFHFFRYGLLDQIFKISVGILTFLSAILCVHLRWITHLNFRQKLNSLMMLAIILLCTTLFTANLFNYFTNDPLVVDELSKSVFFVGLMGFVLMYTLASLLAVMFNLPTSSVFEQRFREIEKFQSLSDEIWDGRNEAQIARMLIRHILETVRADAAWMHLDKDTWYSEGVWVPEALRGQLAELVRGQESPFEAHVMADFSSTLIVPMQIAGHHLGYIALLQRIEGGFDSVTVSIVRTFAAQGSVAIQNHRLLEQKIESERHKNELQIARRVQERLLPKNIETEGRLEIEAYMQSAYEVGGDFYDFFALDAHRYAVLVGDVAGKGISAAFNMAQMRGIFQSLIDTDISPKAFFVRANEVLARCLERHSFISAVYFQIDTSQHQLLFSRAGHCPTIHYRRSTGQATYLDVPGMPLAIQRKHWAGYAARMFEQALSYETGDLLLLYTDGIIEAASPETKEEFGMERLRLYLQQHADQPLRNIIEGLVLELTQFSRPDTWDDCTLVLIRL